MLEYQVIIPDTHYPYQDQAAIDAVFELVEALQPITVLQLGDLLDWYACSSFTKNPQRLLTLQAEIDSAAEFWPVIGNLAPNARKVQLSGNHEVRLQKYLWAHPELSSLTALTVPKLLKLEENGVEHHEYGRAVDLGGFIVTHGSRIGKYGGYSANQELQSKWKSGVSGHTHRLGQTYFTNDSGAYTWVEAGYLGSRDFSQFEYVLEQPNWQQGLCVATRVVGEKEWVLTPVPVLADGVKRRIVFGGGVYGG